jgi:hypothetical protein
MSIPGTSMETDPPVHDGDPNVAPAAEHDDDEGLVQTVKVGDQQMAPVSEVIRYRKEARAAKKELDALKPQIEQARQIGQRLQDVQPILDRLQSMTPQQREALSSGRIASPEGTHQAADDVEAREIAEDYGLISQDGSLDIARARKILNKNKEAIRQGVEQAVGPIRQNTAQQQAASLRQQAVGVTDANGVPLASQESIKEAYDMLPAELAAQPNVAMVALGTAMLIDRMRGRTVKASQTYADPIYSEPAAGRRGGSSITADDRAMAAKVGLTDKDLTAAVTALQRGGNVPME